MGFAPFVSHNLPVVNRPELVGNLNLDQSFINKYNRFVESTGSPTLTVPINIPANLNDVIVIRNWSGNNIIIIDAATVHVSPALSLTVPHGGIAELKVVQYTSLTDKQWDLFGFLALA